MTLPRLRFSLFPFMEPNFRICAAASSMRKTPNATPRRSLAVGGRRLVKRFSPILAVLLCSGALTFPTPAYAWDWVPRVLKFENPYRGLDATRYPGFECKMRNTWGDCVVYSYITKQGPDEHPGSGTPKNYYRRVSSYGIPALNYSDCQYDDYRRSTSPHTHYSTCDYGEPKSFVSGSIQ